MSLIIQLVLWYINWNDGSGGLWDVPSLRIFKDLRKLERTLKHGFPSFSSIHSSNCVLLESWLFHSTNCCHLWVMLSRSMTIPQCQVTQKSSSVSLPTAHNPVHAVLFWCWPHSTFKSFSKLAFPQRKKFQATDYNDCVYLTQYCFEGFWPRHSSLKHQAGTQQMLVSNLTTEYTVNYFNIRAVNK